MGAKNMNTRIPSFQAIKQTIKRIAITIIIALSISLLAPLQITPVPLESWAATIPFSPDPLAAKADRLTTAIGRDPTDIYFPIPLNSNPHQELLPIALLLQGANVDKSSYSLFASILARHGFLVVVPNHLRKFPPIPGLGKDILLPDQHQISDVLAYMNMENSDHSSPLFGAIDLDKLVVIGHSMGGLAGLNAIQDQCSLPLCFGDFTRPAALVGGVFYGTNLKGHFGMKIHPIANAGIPTALIQGTLDGASNLEDTEATYQQIQDSPKAFITIVGANHYGITNTNNPVNPPGLPLIQADPIAPTLDQETAIEDIARWSALFIRAHVMHDRGALDYLQNSAQQSDGSVIVRWHPSTTDTEERTGKLA